MLWTYYVLWTEWLSDKPYIVFMNNESFMTKPLDSKNTTFKTSLFLATEFQYKQPKPLGTGSVVWWLSTRARDW